MHAVWMKYRGRKKSNGGQFVANLTSSRKLFN